MGQKSLPGSMQPHPEELLLDGFSHKLIAKAADCPELGVEIERAVHQVQKSIQDAKILEEEKREISTKNSKNQENREAK